MANRRNVSEPKPEVANYMQGHVKTVSAVKSLYCPDVESWEQYKEYADAQGMSMSDLVFSALEAFVKQECPRCKRIANILATGSVVAKADKKTKE